jgi:tetratricopeptide (TPR) repeat protein
MQRRLHATIAALVVGCLVGAPAVAQFKPWSGSSIVADPEWQKRFLGSYGFLSGAEPDIRPSEIEVLKEVIDLMKVNPRAAATMLEQTKSDDSSAAVDFILANLEFQNGDLEAAEASYESALRKFPDFRRAHKNLGLLRVQANALAGATEHLTRAIELGDRDGRTYGLLGYCYVNLENYVAAETAYRNAVLAEPDTRDWQLGLARSLLAMEQYKEAAALFSSLIEKDPENGTYWMLQANAFLGLNEPLKAAVNLEAARLLGKADIQSLILLGDIYMNDGDADLAREAYLDVVKMDEKAEHFRAAQRAAELLVRVGANADAAALVQSIERRYGKRLDADQQLELMTLQAKLARAQGRPDEAARILETIVQRDGTRGEALLELARYHRDAGNEQKAVLMLERAQNLEDFEYEALVEHAQFEVAERHYDRAANLLRQATRIRSEPRVERFLAQVEEAARRN